MAKALMTDPRVTDIYATTAEVVNGRLILVEYNKDQLIWLDECGMYANQWAITVALRHPGF